MRIVGSSGDAAGWSGRAEITTDHPSSRDGVPVLLVGGEPVAIMTALEAGYQLVEATPEERLALLQGGYRLTDQPRDDGVISGDSETCRKPG